MAKDKIGMIYKGNGFYVSVPARDLTEEEVEHYGREFLLSLDLYQEPDKPQKKTKQFDIEPLDEESEE